MADIPSALGEMQSALDLATLEESKEQAEGESKLSHEDAKAYAHNMSESFGKQVVCIFSQFSKLSVFFSWLSLQHPLYRRSYSPYSKAIRVFYMKVSLDNTGRLYMKRKPVYLF